MVVARPFNTFGPRQSSRAIIPTLITQMINQKFIRVGNIDTKRDFTFIEDTIDGFMTLINSNKGIGEVINIASGFEIEIKELITLIRKQLKIKKLKIIFDKKRIRPKPVKSTGCLHQIEKLKKYINGNQNIKILKV